MLPLFRSDCYRACRDAQAHVDRKDDRIAGFDQAHQRKGLSCALGEGASAERPSPLHRCGRYVPLSEPGGLRFGVGNVESNLALYP
jgi:hypothetical protein